MRTPTNDTAFEGEHSACARVAEMIIMSSIPYIFFRPRRSARYRKPTWPITAPAEVATLIAVSELCGMTPPFDSCQKTIPIIAVVNWMANNYVEGISTHSAISREMKCAPHTVSISEEANTSDHNQSGMIPSEWSFIDFREGHPSPLVRVHDVGIDSR